MVVIFAEGRSKNKISTTHFWFLFCESYFAGLASHLLSLTHWLLIHRGEPIANIIAIVPMLLPTEYRVLTICQHNDNSVTHTHTVQTKGNCSITILWNAYITTVLQSWKNLLQFTHINVGIPTQLSQALIALDEYCELIANPSLAPCKMIELERNGRYWSTSIFHVFCAMYCMYTIFLGM